MNIPFIDIASLSIILFFLLLGLLNGFIKEVFSLIAWIGSILIAWNYGGYISPYLSDFGIQSQFLEYISFLLVFIILFIVFTLLGKFFNGIISLLGLKMLDRVLGGILATAKSIVILVGIFIFSLDYLEEKIWWDNSFTKVYTLKIKALSEAFINPSEEINPSFQKNRM
ncbi:MAG: CvpA family protein [SAR86 cluster bacterium]|nr:CvpA family protein [SAR86 cluster bacterium]